MNIIKEVDTFTCNIFVGFREGYSDIIVDIKLAENICQNYCDNIGYCVTVTPTKFIYKNGNEPGCKVGLINYPRFTEEKQKIKEHAFSLAKLLKKEYKQNRVSIVCSDKTYMI